MPQSAGKGASRVWGLEQQGIESVGQVCWNLPAAALYEQAMDPRSGWSDPAAYDRQARELAERFEDHYQRYAGSVPSDSVEG